MRARTVWSDGYVRRPANGILEACLHKSPCWLGRACSRTGSTTPPPYPRHTYQGLLQRHHNRMGHRNKNSGLCSSSSREHETLLPPCRRSGPLPWRLPPEYLMATQFLPFILFSFRGRWIGMASATASHPTPAHQKKEESRNSQNNEPFFHVQSSSVDFIVSRNMIH